MDAFPGQSIDFFGALRSRVYDDMVREHLQKCAVHQSAGRLMQHELWLVVWSVLKQPIGTAFSCVSLK